MSKIITPASSKFLLVLLAIYAVEFAVLAFNPVDRPTWLAETVTVWIIISILAVAWMNKIRFSNMTYALAAVLIYLHTIGSHFTFALVPFDYVTNFFNFERNHFDRVAHATVGLYAFGIAEWLLMKRAVRNTFTLITFPILSIVTVAAAYEVIEMVYAIAYGGDQAANYLGSQGDPWDAQKDIVADTLGAIAAMIIFYFYYGKKRIQAMLAA